MKRLIVTDNFAKMTDSFSDTSYDVFRELCQQLCHILCEKYNPFPNDEPPLIVEDYTDAWAEALLKGTTEAKQSFWEKVTHDGYDRKQYPRITFVHVFPESAINEAPHRHYLEFVMKQRSYEKTLLCGDTNEIEDYLFLANRAQGKTVHSSLSPAAAIPPTTMQAASPVEQRDIPKYPPQIQAEHNVPIESEPVTTPPIFIATSKFSTLDMYNDGKPLSEPVETVLTKIDTDAPKDLKKIMPQPLTKADMTEIVNGLTVVMNEIKEKIPTENTIFEAHHRANARFNESIDETDIEKIDRLRKDGWSWKDVAKQVYFDREGVEISEADLDREVGRLQAQHKRAYPECYTKRKK